VGIGGHMLSEKNTKKLAARSGLAISRAYRRGQYCEAAVHGDGCCQHYSIDFKTGDHELIEDPGHWSSCPGRR
jgi:hypothetical protein